MSSDTTDQKVEESLLEDSDIDDFVDVVDSLKLRLHPNLIAGPDYDVVAFLVGSELQEDYHIRQVLGYCMQTTYCASETDPRVEMALDMSIQLIERDYTTVKVDNTKGVLTTYYPAKIPFLKGEIVNQNVIYENSYTQEQMADLVNKALSARCRQRFPVPVIMYQGKSICRSSTLAGGAEVYGRRILGILSPANASNDDEFGDLVSLEEPRDAASLGVINDLQTADIALLKRLKVGTIVDLMVENRKTKMGVPVTSSEKANKDNQYHNQLKLLSLPFPGCEFFKEFFDNNYNPQGLVFNWDQPMCDAPLTVPEYPPLDYLNIEWDNYKQWDLVEMTQNYFKYIIKYFQGNESGILVHCISGWDRTPLFISLLRLSLWADGVIHKSLNVHEILFLTLAYDWMLFGHHLCDRMEKHEDIMLYCFTILKHLVGDEYSIFSIKPKLEEQVDGIDELSSEKKTDVLSNISENDLTSESMDDKFPFNAESVVSADESNDSMYYGIESPISLAFPESPAEVSTFSEMTSPIPMDVSEGDLNSNLESCNGTTPAELCYPGSPKCGGDSNSLSSWHIVSATGSIRGSDTQSEVDGSISQGSNGTINSDEPASRKSKLVQVRRLFYRCYYQTASSKGLFTRGLGSTIMRGVLFHLVDIANMPFQEAQ